jgi:hypothetical protein
MQNSDGQSAMPLDQVDPTGHCCGCNGVGQDLRGTNQVGAASPLCGRGHALNRQVSITHPGKSATCDSLNIDGESWIISLGQRLLTPRNSAARVASEMPV